MLQHRLRKHADYQRAYAAAGRKQFGKLLAYFAAPRAAETRSETPGPRVGITVPKALGGAVDRNRIKRRLRECVRLHIDKLEGLPVDVILHPKRTVKDCDYAALDREVAITFRAAAAKLGGSKPGTSATFNG
ncbi:ribonuclease P protein component [Granulicella cerasi]|uniref:Ribonuclease P protein component n=1 Tax=Granulicella cerasi TaxID=741063 RepID=A0ABW1Z9C6_9BACT|nr:ribonuclease P protein component [Granulicella cerasi]